jgi:hypothetical protein
MIKCGHHLAGRLGAERNRLLPARRFQRTPGGNRPVGKHRTEVCSRPIGLAWTRRGARADVAVHWPPSTPRTPNAQRARATGLRPIWCLPLSETIQRAAVTTRRKDFFSVNRGTRCGRSRTNRQTADLVPELRCSRGHRSCRRAADCADKCVRIDDWLWADRPSVDRHGRRLNRFDKLGTCLSYERSSPSCNRMLCRAHG